MESPENTATNNRFAQLLRSSRLAVGLTQEELAAAAEMSSRAVGNLERGRTLPHRSTVDRLARALGADDALRMRLRRLAHGRQQPEIPGERATASPAAPTAGRLCELPPDPAGFVGRREELAALHGYLDELPPAGFCLLVGPAGAGKTALAVHFARRVADSFPDGRLYGDLRGTGGHRLTAVQMLQRFVRALDRQTGPLPDDYDELVGLFRTLVADRSVLFVLDGADSAAQVRAFVPSGERSLLIAISRRRLESLDAPGWVRRVTVGGLDPWTAAMFVSAAGGSDCPPEVGERIARACANLPTALRIATIRALHGPGFRAVADELADPGTRLAVLSTTDRELSLESVLAEAHDALDPAVATLLRRLGLHPSRRIDVGAAAAAAGVPTDQARQALAALREHHLAEHVGGETYQLSEFAYCYAANRVRRDEPTAQTAAVHRRLARWYLAAADAADRVLSAGRFRAGLDAVGDGIQPPRFADRDQALAWCDEHLGVLVSVTQTAAGSGPPAVAWQLPWALGGYFELRRPADRLRMHEIGLAAARHDQHLLGQAVMLVGLGHAHYYPRRFDDAAACYAEATELWRRLDDRHGEAVALNSTGNVYLETRRLTTAITHYEQALTAFHDVGDRRGEGVVLGNLAEACCEFGDYVAATDYATRALAISRETDNARCESLALCQLARAAATASAAKARELFREALAVSRNATDRHAEAWTLTYIGAQCVSEGVEQEAVRTWEAAIHLFDTLDDPQADHLRGRVVSITGRTRRP